MLVCPGQITMTLLPMFPTACMMPPPRPSPNASSNTTETTPHEMPNIVSIDRMRLRRSAVQLCWISSFRRIVHLRSFVVQALNRFEFSRAPRRIHARADRDQRKGEQRTDYRNRGNNWPRNKVRKRCSRHQETDSHAQAVTNESTERGDHNRFRKKLIQNVDLGGTNRLHDADLARPLCDCDQHNVHHANAAKSQRGNGDTSKEDSD